MNLVKTLTQPDWMRSRTEVIGNKWLRQFKKQFSKRTFKSEIYH
ncbi:hypothetical protein [Nostoc sp.]